MSLSEDNLHWKASEDKAIIVLGAGVVGLTTALMIQEKNGYNVTILAEMLPLDAKSHKYTSPWAGAHHVASTGGDVRQQRMEKETFTTMWQLSEPGGEAEGCFLRAPQTELYLVPQPNPDLLSYYPDFQHLPAAALSRVPNVISAVSLTALGINTPVYLPYLLSRFLASGGTVIRASVQHINQVLEGGVGGFTGDRAAENKVDALVVCVGLGARTLGGVEDKAVYPVRGQTVILRAPWVQAGISLVSESGSKTYIIPRRGGHVVVGGTRVANDWYPAPRPETALDILQRGLDLCPDLAPPDIRAQRAATIEDLRPLIVEEGCGLRPAREGGIRLESEWADVPGSMGSKIPIIYNYGHGGYGFQTSWGSASIAVDLLEKALTTAQASS
ncbi:D-aspartate oxidase [Amylostereum chailletii]|nr:D-aspartate oxidase [Amylostereum chailletii]